ncbi:MAG: YeeE/YedE family protein [Acidobacteria bacterium]|nr:YeeE/YedE family protein [Acidobacteriota bacterium]
MYWSWLKSGFALGLCFLLAVILVKPIGVSTQFVILDGMIASVFNRNLVFKDEASESGYASSNAYLNKSGGKYAKSVANPLNYSFLFVLAMLLGGIIGGIVHRRKTKHPIRQTPEFHQRRFMNAAVLRYVLAFVGGIVVLWGARMAGGCTSGNMMSGIMQTAVSGYFFAAATFIVAIPVAIFIYRK